MKKASKKLKKGGTMKASIVDKHISISEQEAAPILGVIPATMANWRASGKGPSFFLAGTRSIRYTLSDVLAFREARRVRPKNNRRT